MDPAPTVEHVKMTPVVRLLRLARHARLTLDEGIRADPPMVGKHVQPHAREDDEKQGGGSQQRQGPHGRCRVADETHSGARRMTPGEAAAEQREVTLTTTGRKSGKPRKVTIWISTDGRRSVIPRLPALKEHLHLSDGQVGIALLGLSLGGITGALLSRLVIRRDARRYARLALALLCVTLIGPGLATNIVQLFASFYLIGFCCGALDVLVNAQGTHLENTEGSTLMHRFDGFCRLCA